MEEQYFDEPEEMEDEEISLSDRVVGVFTEPTNLFTKIAQGQAKVTDWLIPLLLMMCVVVAMQFIISSNPSLQQQVHEKTVTQLEEQVENDTINQEQADAQLNAMEQNKTMMVMFQVIGTLIMFPIIFFIIASYFILGAKFGLKGEGTYKEGLSAYGLTGYISIIQLVAVIVMMIVMDSIEAGTNLAKFMGEDVKELNGYLLAYIDPIKIWAFAVMSIGLAKINKSESTGKYYGFVFGSWVIVGLLFFLLTEAVPFMKNFIQ